MNILNWITNLDLAINHWIQENLRNDFLTRFFTFITSLSNYGWFWLLLIIVLLINKKTRKVGIIAFVSFCACALVVNVFMKPLFMRTRPYDLVDFLIYIGHKPWDYSFPSGHTAASFASVSALYFAGRKRMAAGALIVSVLIAFSRMYLYVHYPTDVLGGLIIGLLCGWIADMIIQKVMEKRSRKSR